MRRKDDLELIAIAVILIAVLAYGIYLTLGGAFTWSSDSSDHEKHKDIKVLPDINLGPN
jgi:hypothetical protein